MISGFPSPSRSFTTILNWLYATEKLLTGVAKENKLLAVVFLYNMMPLVKSAIVNRSVLPSPSISEETITEGSLSVLVDRVSAEEKENALPILLLNVRLKGSAE